MCDFLQSIFTDLGVDFKNGFGDLINKIEKLNSEDKKQEIKKDIALAFEKNASIAMN